MKKIFFAILGLLMMAGQAEATGFSVFMGSWNVEMRISSSYTQDLVYVINAYSDSAATGYIESNNSPLVITWSSAYGNYRIGVQGSSMAIDYVSVVGDNMIGSSILTGTRVVAQALPVEAEPTQDSASYNASSNILHIPSVIVDGHNYSADLTLIGSNPPTFTLSGITPRN